MSEEPSDKDIMSAHIDSLKAELAAAKQALDEEENNKLRAIGLYDSCQSELNRVTDLHKVLMKLADERADEAERRLAECEKDAARYRWLRKDDLNVLEVCTCASEIVTGQFDGFDLQIGEALDASIDSAIAKEQSHE